MQSLGFDFHGVFGLAIGGAAERAAPAGRLEPRIARPPRPWARGEAPKT